MRNVFSAIAIATAFVAISASAQTVTVTIGAGFSGWKEALSVPADQRQVDWYKALDRMVIGAKCDDSVRRVLADRFGFGYVMEPAEDISAKEVVNIAAKQAGCHIPE